MPRGGGSSTSTVSNRTGEYKYSGTQSPGDIWTWDISTSEFIATNETLSYWITGEWSALSTGFSKATVLGSGGTGGSFAPSIESTVYFLEFPNTMLLVRPVKDNDERVIICAAAATGEPIYFGPYAFVNVPKEGFVNPTPVFGTVEVHTPSWTFDFTNFDITGEPINFVSGTDEFSWSNGTFTSESTSMKIFMTPSGIFFGDVGTVGGGGFVGASPETFSPSTFLSVLHQTYKGVRFIYYPTAITHVSSGTGETDAITCAYATFGTMDALQAKRYTSIEDNKTSAGGYITFGPQNTGTGFIPGAFIKTGETTPEQLQCAVSNLGTNVNPVYFLFGVGFDREGLPFNILLVSTP